MTTFDHVHLFCTDLEAMVAFWTKGLGAEFVKYRKFGPADGAVVSVGGTPIYLKVVPADAPAPVGGSRGLDHIGIRVEDPASFSDNLVNSYACRLLSQSNGNFFVAHPDGLVLEVMPASAEI